MNNEAYSDEYRSHIISLSLYSDQDAFAIPFDLAQEKIGEIRASINREKYGAKAISCPFGPSATLIYRKDLDKKGVDWGESEDPFEQVWHLANSKPKDSERSLLIMISKHTEELTYIKVENRIGTSNNNSDEDYFRAITNTIMQKIKDVVVTRFEFGDDPDQVKKKLLGHSFSFLFAKGDG